MFLEGVLLSGCSLLLLYSTAGVRGGCASGLRAKGAPRLGFYVLCIVRFFTKPLIFYDKLVRALELGAAGVQGTDVTRLLLCLGEAVSGRPTRGCGA